MQVWGCRAHLEQGPLLHDGLSCRRARAAEVREVLRAIVQLHLMQRGHLQDALWQLLGALCTLLQTPRLLQAEALESLGGKAFRPGGVCKLLLLCLTPPLYSKAPAPGPSRNILAAQCHARQPFEIHDGLSHGMTMHL